MTMPVLVPCPSCARHIAASEESCPFCASVVPEDLASRAIPANNRRLTRFAMFTFASTVTAIGIGSGFSSMSCAVYGAPCNPCFDYEQDGGDSGGFQPSDGATPYDAAFPVDAESPDANDASFIDDSGDASDASSEDAD